MSRRQVYDQESFAHFVTFSCYRTRRLLDHDQPKQIALGVLRDQLKRQSATRVGLVEKTVDWKWSSVRRYEQGRSVGVALGRVV